MCPNTLCKYGKPTDENFQNGMHILAFNSSYTEGAFFFFLHAIFTLNLL